LLNPQVGCRKLGAWHDVAGVRLHTLGKANGRLPAILDQRLPHLNVEDSDGPAHGDDKAGLEDTGELRPAATI
jgi:hypothetical protein